MSESEKFLCGPVVVCLWHCYILFHSYFRFGRCQLFVCFVVFFFCKNYLDIKMTEKNVIVIFLFGSDDSNSDLLTFPTGQPTG